MADSGIMKCAIRFRRTLALLMQVVLAAVTVLLAFLIRFDGRLSLASWEAILRLLPFAIAIRLGFAMAFRLHCGLWRYAGMDDLLRIIKAYTLGTVVLIAATAFTYHLRGIPRSVFILDWLLGILFMGGKRMSIRMLRHWLETRRGLCAEGRTLLIAGAGDAGAEALRVLRTTPGHAGAVLGFLDDDPHKQGLMVHGRRVLGTLADAPDRIRALQVDEVLIAMPSVSKRVLRELVESCEGLEVRFRILPAIADLVTGQLHLEPIREVQLEDLLGRDAIELDRSAVGWELSRECVLITGAAGSIGSEIARQVAAHRPRRLVLMDMAESALFEIDREIERIFPDVDRVAVIADMRDRQAVDALFARHRPQRVFHAAAYKHVPLMQAHPLEAVTNNVFGTQTLAQAAARHGTRKFVLISTDKAVRPCNVMGATKRVAERIVAHQNGGATRFVAVRFGNVLGSNGSVIPIFRRQIAAGGPVTVTHPEMERFFMTIPEAVELVLQAGAMGEDGDVFVLEMGEQIRIRDLAENLIRLSGLRPHQDIEIEYTGLRPGEKLSEELVAQDENLAPTGVPKLNVLRRNGGHTPESRAAFEEGLRGLETATQARDEAAVRAALAALAGCVEQPAAAALPAAS